MATQRRINTLLFIVVVVPHLFVDAFSNNETRVNDNNKTRVSDNYPNDVDSNDSYIASKNYKTHISLRPSISFSRSINRNKYYVSSFHIVQNITNHIHEQSSQHLLSGQSTLSHGLVSKITFASNYVFLESSTQNLKHQVSSPVQGMMTSPRHDFSTPLIRAYSPHSTPSFPSLLNTHASLNNTSLPHVGATSSLATVSYIFPSNDALLNATKLTLDNSHTSKISSKSKSFIKESYSSSVMVRSHSRSIEKNNLHSNSHRLSSVTLTSVISKQIASSNYVSISSISSMNSSLPSRGFSTSLMTSSILNEKSVKSDTKVSSKFANVFISSTNSLKLFPSSLPTPNLVTSSFKFSPSSPNIVNLATSSQNASRVTSTYSRSFSGNFNVTPSFHRSASSLSVVQLAFTALTTVNSNIFKTSLISHPYTTIATASSKKITPHASLSTSLTVRITHGINATTVLPPTVNTTTPINNTTVSPPTNNKTATPTPVLNTTALPPSINTTILPPTDNKTTPTSRGNITTVIPPVNTTTPLSNRTTESTMISSNVTTTSSSEVVTTTPTSIFLESLLVSQTANAIMIRIAIPYEYEQLSSFSVLVQEYTEDNNQDNEEILTWYDVYHEKKHRYNRYRAVGINSSKLIEFFKGHDDQVYHLSRKKRDTWDSSSFLIGGDKECASVICNGPLKPSRSYRFQVEAILKDNKGRRFSPFTKTYSTTQKDQVKTTSETITPPVTYGPSSTILILLASLLITFIVIIVIILIVVFKRRRGSHTICGGRASEELRTALMGPCHKNGSKRDRFSTSSLIMERKKSLKGMTRPVSIRDFRAWVLRSSSDSEFRFAEEFESMRDVGRMERHEVADMPENRGKNRYVNILAYDFTRVKLSSIDDEPGSDYINANYIHGYKQPRAYIATQGPLPSTEDDFWRMTWEQNSRVVVMVTQCTERGRVKCHQYWPENAHAQRYGDIVVTPINERHFQEWIEREFILEYDNETRNLKHFQYVAWPDHGVPKSTTEMLKFVQTIKNVEKASNGPLICHCSAGVGRTGTYLCVDILLNKLQCESNVDVYGVVCMMRTQRCFMVQTEEQYIFIHRVILAYLEQREQYSTLMSPNRMQRPRVEGEENGDGSVREALLEYGGSNVDIVSKGGFLSEFDPDIYNKNHHQYSAETKT